MIHELQFFDFVDDFLERRPDGLIGVHGTRGVNRPGYLIARYLIEKFSWDPKVAIKVSVIHLYLPKMSFLKFPKILASFVTDGNFMHIYFFL